MAEPERAQLHRAVDEVVVWLTEGTETLRQRTAVGARRDRAVAALESRITTVASGSRTWQILPLGPHDDATLADLAAFDAMSTLSTQHAVLFEELTTAVAADLPAARAAASWRGRVQRRLVGSANTAAARRVLDFHARALAAGLPAVIRSARPGALDGTDALDLGSHVPAVRGRVSVIPAAALGPVTSAAQGSDAAQFASPSPVTSAARAAGTALEQAEQHRARLAEDVHAVREATVRPALDALPLERLAEQADGVLRRAPLEEAGLRSVGDVYAARRELVRLPGVSPRLAHRAAAAAEAWFAEVATSQRVLDVHALHPPSRAHARVAERLSEGQPLRSVARRREHLETIRGLLPLGRALDEGATRLLVSGDAEHAAALRQHLEALVATGLHLRDS
ncbi:MAG: hypothetical protein Q4G34_08580, partial [Micrococcus sp.]|nr:hypothetical protein [Micrococcus sp.]